jgi:DNA-binding NarL/FixJ family response regulator
MNKPSRVLLADDHGLFRAATRSLVRSFEAIEVIAEASSGREALDLCKTHRIDVVLMDVIMPQLNGLDATARLRTISPHTRSIILSAYADEERVLQAMRCGASGYLPKSIPPLELERAIRTVSRGERYLSPAISKHVIAACMQIVSSEAIDPLDRLTPRQREVLQLIAEGCTTKEIARKLSLRPKTVDMYRGQLMATLNIHEIAGLVRYAIRKGITSSDV